MGQIGKLDLCLERVGELDLSTLVHRKLLQKRVYFLQEFGVRLGYSYGFYLYGPYSTDLTRDAFFLSRLKNNAPDTLELVELSGEEETALERTAAFLGEINGDPSEIADKLEILSSLHYLWCVSYFQTKTKEEVFRRVRERKPLVTFRDLEEAWALLTRFGLMT
jgi:uncharacterized protein YwgA